MEHETIQIPEKKMRNRAKKYPEGSLQHRKDINYNKLYYDKHVEIVSCSLCCTPILAQCIVRHQKTLRCLKYRLCVTKPESIIE